MDHEASNNRGKSAPFSAQADGIVQTITSSYLRATARHLTEDAWPSRQGWLDSKPQLCTNCTVDTCGTKFCL